MAKQSKSIKKESYSNYLLVIVVIVAVIGIVLMVNNGDCVSDDTDNTINDENNLIGLAHGRDDDRNDKRKQAETPPRGESSTTNPLGGDDQEDKNYFIYIPKEQLPKIYKNKNPKVVRWGLDEKKIAENKDAILEKHDVEVFIPNIVRVDTPKVAEKECKLYCETKTDSVFVGEKCEPTEILVDASYQVNCNKECGTPILEDDVAILDCGSDGICKFYLNEKGDVTGSVCIGGLKCTSEKVDALFLTSEQCVDVYEDQSSTVCEWVC